MREYNQLALRSRIINDVVQCSYCATFWLASRGLQQCLGHPCNTREERNRLQTLFWATREYCCHPWLYNSFLGFHIGCSARFGLVLFGRTRPVVIIFSRCYFTTLYKLAQPSPLRRNINMYIAMSMYEVL